MRRPDRLLILEYALEGAITRRGVDSNQSDEEQQDEWDDHIKWLESEITRCLKSGRERRQE